MAIYKIDDRSLVPLQHSSFAREGLRERDHIQALLKAQIEAISADTLVVAEEFSDWEDSRRRIDLLGIDKNANLVVIELKRTEDGGHMELQALRYAAMISQLTFERLVSVFDRYLAANSIEQNARETLLDFLGWSDPQEDQFGKEIRIVLAAAEFSKELMTTVIWLNDYKLDIRCVRIQLYMSQGQQLLDIQTVFPLPEAADYQIRIREKQDKVRESREQSRDLTRYDALVEGRRFEALPKRRLMFQVIAAVLRHGGTPEQIMESIPWRRNRLFEVFDGTLNEGEVQNLLGRNDEGGASERAKRFFCADDELFHIRGKTYVLSNQWGTRTIDAVDDLLSRFPQLGFEYSAVG